MPTALPDARRLRISKAESKAIEAWKEGVDLEAKSGTRVALLCRVATQDRWRLALEHYRDAKANMNADKPAFRAAISRYYYAMYHAFRAASYAYHNGDDFEEHKLLPANLPKDFPSVGTWQNDLKNAREHRNHADYDPYPGGRNKWMAIAAIMQTKTDQAMSEVRLYLRNKGCKV